MGVFVSCDVTKLVNVKIIVITLFVVMLVAFITPTFAQQFREPDYTIRGAEIIGFDIDPKTTSLIVSLDARARGELIITLPRSLIDAKIGFGDSDFDIFVSGLKLISYDETKTSQDRTVTIPIKRGNSEIIITGTHVFSQVSTAQTTQPQSIEKRIADELRNEIPDSHVLNLQLLEKMNSKID